MKVAVYDPLPRISGVSTYARHAREGLFRLGHEVKVITFTRSGKPSELWGDGRSRWLHARGAYANAGCRWSPWAPDLVGDSRDPVPLLRQFDAVFLAEPRCPPLDGRDDTFETYCRPMELCPAPWFTVVHGGTGLDLSPRGAPRFLELEERAMSRPQFRGYGVTRPRTAGTHPTFSRHPHVATLVIPYAVTPSPCSAPRDVRELLLPGRLTTSKGIGMVPHLAEALPEGWLLSVRGACSVGAGPCCSWTVAERLAGLDWDVQVELDESAARAHAAGMRPTLKPHPWEAAKPGRCRVRYHGGCDDMRAAAESAGAAASLTHESYQAEMVEYAMLEAMDAGCLAVLPPTQARGGEVAYAGVVVEGFTAYDRELADGQAAQVARDLARLLGTEEHGRSVARNRALLLKHHEPSRVVSRLLSLLGKEALR